jgi:hypothetical protein
MQKLIDFRIRPVLTVFSEIIAFILSQLQNTGAKNLSSKAHMAGIIVKWLRNAKLPLKIIYVACFNAK